MTKKMNRSFGESVLVSQVYRLDEIELNEELSVESVLFRLPNKSWINGSSLEIDCFHNESVRFCLP